MTSHVARVFWTQQDFPQPQTIVKLPFQKVMSPVQYQIVLCPNHLLEPRLCTLEERNNRIYHALAEIQSSKPAIEGAMNS